MEELLEVSHKRVAKQRSKKSSSKNTEREPAVAGGSNRVQENLNVASDDQVTTPTENISIADIHIGTNLLEESSDLYGPTITALDAQPVFPVLGNKIAQVSGIVEYPQEIGAASAPPLDFVMISDTAWMDGMGADEVIQELGLEPLSDDLLAQIYENHEIPEHSKAVEEFRHNTNSVSPHDDFFAWMAEYERSQFLADKSKAELRSALQSTSTAAGRVWILKRVSKVAEDKCNDGIRVSHTYTSEAASLNDDEMKDLEQTVHKLEKTLLPTHRQAVFNMKLVRLWIQNMIDGFLCHPLFDSSSIIGGMAQDHEASLPEVLAQIKRYLDILFYFERRFSKYPATAQQSNKKIARTGEDFDDEATPISPFAKDVRGWIAHLIGGFLKIALVRDKRFILLHVLRTRGIGLWGRSFVYWGEPDDWTDEYLDHYLTALHAFLGPVEELEEELHIKETEIVYVKESLRKLEESDWIVVADIAEQQGPLVQVTILTEDDYLSLFEQFNIYNNYTSFLRSCTTQWRLFKEAGDKNASLPLRIFAVTNQIITIFSRGLQYFSKSLYPRLLKKIAVTLLDVVNHLAEYLHSTLNPWVAELSYEDHPFDTILSFDGIHKTTIQAEIDGSFYRTVAVFLRYPRADIWSVLPLIRLHVVADKTKWKILHSMIVGQHHDINNRLSPAQVLSSYVTIKDITQELSTILSANLNEASYLLSMIVNVVVLSKANTNYRSGHIDLNFRKDMAQVVARVIFHLCFLHMDFKTDYQKKAIDFMTVICESHPSLISSYLLWTRDNFASLGSLCLVLFDQIDLGRWQPSLADLALVTNMLKDPTGSIKYQLAQKIISRLNWGYIDESEELFIPRSHHRLVALAVTNLYLDRYASTELSAFLAGSTAMAVAASALVAVNSLATMSSPTRGQTREMQFHEWCWSIILNLKLYQRPTSQDTYALEAFGPNSKPFEHLESTSLATLRGAMKTNALAAYVILMMSELGHSIPDFYRDGWALLNVIVESGVNEALINITNEIFVEFVRMDGPGFCQSQEFCKLFSAYFKTRFRLATSSRLCDGDALHDIRILSDLREWTFASLPMLVWACCVCHDRDWPTDPNRIALLDLVCEVSLLYNYDSHVIALFRDIFRNMTVAHFEASKRSSKLSITNPLGTVAALANVVKDRYSGFPTLLYGSRKDWGSNFDSIRGKIPVEKDYIWFAYYALTVETYEEAPYRLRIANVLSRDGLVTVSSVQDESPKPLCSFAIYKWAAQCIATPVEHPALPLIFQSFFSLYFEVAPSPIVRTHGRIGHRFFVERKDIVAELEQKLQQCLSRLKSSKDKLDMDTTKSPTERRRVDTVLSLYNGMTLWLRESRLHSPDIYLDHLGETYDIPRLKSVMDGSILTSLDSKWIDLIPSDAILKSLSTIKSTKIISPVSSRRGSLVVEPESRVVDHITTSAVTPPSFFRREPIVPMFQNFSLQSAMHLFDDNVQLLFDRSIPYNRNLESIVEHDKLFFQLLTEMYVNEDKRGRIEKRCGSNCTGNAVISFQYNDVKLQNAIKVKTQENRTLVEDLTEWDNMDSKLCTNALRLIRALEWYCSDEVPEKDITQIERAAIKLFHRVITEADESRRVYPPVSMLYMRAVDKLGKVFICNSSSETLKLFEHLKTIKASTTLIKIFNPACCADEFTRMYKELSLSFNDRPSGLSIEILSQFAVETWIETSSLEDNSKLAFFRCLLEVIEITPKVLTDAESVRSLVDIHRMHLQKFACHPKAEHLLPQLIIAALEYLFEAKVPPFVLEELLRASTFDPISSKMAETVEIVQSKISKSGFYEIFAALQSGFGRICQNSPQGLYSLDDHLQSLLLDLHVLSFSAKPMFSMSSDIQREELWKLLKRVCLPWFGVAVMTTRENAFKVAVWESRQAAFAETAMARIVSLARKICKVNSAVEAEAGYIWEILSCVIDGGLPDYAMANVSNVIVNSSVLVKMSINPDKVQDMLRWSTKGLLAHETNGRLLRTLAEGSWPRIVDSQDIENILSVVLYLVKHSENACQDSTVRVRLLSLIGQHVNAMFMNNEISTHQFSKLVNQVSPTWEVNLSSLTVADPCLNSLSFTLHLMRIIAGLVWEQGKLRINADPTDKLLIYLDYIMDIIESQLTLSASSVAPLMTSFLPDSMDAIISELFSYVEATSGRINISLVQANMKHCLSRLFTILNHTNKGSNEFSKLWKGINDSLHASTCPLLWLTVACEVVASVEHMALLCESAIEHEFVININSRDSASTWNTIMAALIVPELELDSFVRWCLSHALILTLYAHALQKLVECGNNPDLRVVLGEQVGLWIAGLKMESAADEASATLVTVGGGGQTVTTVASPKAGKIVLPLLLFADLLSEELSKLTLPEHHSRLRVHLPAIADSLLKWGEDRASQGLWAALGFGPKSRLSPEFRLFARATGTFIVMRLLGWSGEKKDAEHKAKLVAAVSSVSQSREYEACWSSVDEIVAWLADEDGKRLGSLREFVALGGAFSAYNGRELRV